MITSRLQGSSKWLTLILLLTVSTLLFSCVSNHKAIKQSRDLRRLAEAYMAKGEYSGALKYLLDAQAIYADDYLLHDGLGKAYVAKERYDLAIKHFKQALNLNPEYAPGKNNLGSAYLLAGQWDDAIKTFKELNDNLLYATPHYPMYNLGWAYYNKKEYQTAIKYYQKSLKLQHGFILPLRGLALSYQKMGNLKLAIAYFEKATEKNPRFPELYYDMGQAYVEANDLKKAVASFNEVIHIKPNSALADQAKMQIQIIQK